MSQYRQHSADTSTLLDQLIERYQHEGLTMPYTMEQFRHDYVKEHFKELTPAERRRFLKEHLEDLTPEERLRGLSQEDIDKHLKRRQQQSSACKRRKDGGT